MCTFIKHGRIVGRNLDVYKTYGEQIVITPRKYCISLRREDNIPDHYAIIGMGTVSRGYPLYFDAANEYGLYMAGLNYIGNANYLPQRAGCVNLAPYELIPYILSKCKTVRNAEHELEKINLTDIPFSRELPTAELHWVVADSERAITVEPDAGGLNIYDNPVGVLTNNPPFSMQMMNLCDYADLRVDTPDNTLIPDIPLEIYSEGMGALGLPGDASSRSRFVRAVFHKANSRHNDDPTAFFHLLSSVEMPDGSVMVGDAYERTEYSSAVDLSTLTYYYRLYGSAGISAVRLCSENPDSHSLIRYPAVRHTPTYQN